MSENSSESDADATFLAALQRMRESEKKPPNERKSICNNVRRLVDPATAATL